MPLDGPVLVVGAGLLGTSIGLALRRQGIDVALRDVSDEHLRIATGIGASNIDAVDVQPQLVVVAVPPDHLVHAITEALTETDAVVTDVGSIKQGAAAGDAGGWSSRSGSPATWAATRSPAASARDRSRRQRRCSTAGPGRSRPTTTPTRPRSSWSPSWPGSAARRR